MPILLGFAAFLGANLLMNDTPQSAQQIDAQIWTAAKFEAKTDARDQAPGLHVLANHDPVQLDARAGTPLKIGNRTYKKGLYCHAVSKILVRLPGPGQRFTAEVGLDHNDDTAHGKGSVVFSATVEGQEAFRSEVMRFGTPAKAVDIDLRGQTEFTLEIGDAGDGIGWDQSDWADAKVVLADGKQVWLSDLPLLNPIAYDSAPPFSFNCDGAPFAEISKNWKIERSTAKIDENRTGYTVNYTDPTTGLSVRCEAVAYRDFPTVEWTVYLKNAGPKDSPRITALRGIDTSFHATGPCVLNHWQGSLARPNDFEPYQKPLEPGDTAAIRSEAGRPSQGAFPYFNLQTGLAGKLLAVGWPGQWVADFGSGKDAVRIQAGQETTDFVLHSGEEVRTPLIALQFTDGSLVDAQNVWRKWFLAYNTPHQNGKPLGALHVACSSHQFNEMLNATEATQKEFIDGYLAHGFKLDYWWMDAGWYPNDGGWGFTGTWRPDPKRFPNGLRAVSDYGRTKGVKTIVWFEPERVHLGTELQQQHPEWMLSYDGKGSGADFLLNLGDPKALAWLTNHINKTIDEQGIDFYRQDYNIDPLAFWQIADAPNRQGITENHYVAGYLAYWDGLLKAHPGMPIDTCASGGRRLDLETLRRSVPLLRSDYIFEPVGQQGHTFGLSFWVPYQGSGQKDIDPYLLRSVMISSINTCWDVRRKDLDYRLAQKLFAEWRSVNACFLGDYYPLTRYSVADEDWIAWQFNLPSEDRGVVQAFRRAGSAYETARYKLHGLDPKARYEVRDFDAARPMLISGKELMEKGLLVKMTKAPCAAMIAYRREK